MKKQEALKTEVATLKERLATLEDRLAWATEIGCKSIESVQAWQAAYYRDVPGARQPATVQAQVST
jgi:hypothetical protein